MATLINRVMFRAASSGTGSFVVASAITGYMTPATGGAANATVYSYAAESDDRTEWEIGTGTYTSGTTTLTRTPLKSSNSDAAVNFTAAPKVALTGLAADFVKVADADASGFGFVVDEDNMASNSATKVPTQQSVKAYVDSHVAADAPPIVILATGQSNFTLTFSEAWDPPSNLQLWNWDPNVNDDGDVGTAFAAMSNTTIAVPWLFAAEVAKANPTREVRLINISFSGQAIAKWISGATAPNAYGAIQANVTAALTALGVSSIDCMIWWQGESDASGASTTYVANWQTVHAQFLAETWFPVSTPVVVMGLSEVGATYANYTKNLAALAALDPDRVIFCRTGLLPSSYWNSTFNFHIEANGAHQAARLAFNALVAGGMRANIQNMLVDPATGNLRYGGTTFNAGVIAEFGRSENSVQQFRVSNGDSGSSAQAQIRVVSNGGSMNLIAYPAAVGSIGQIQWSGSFGLQMTATHASGRLQLGAQNAIAATIYNGNFGAGIVGADTPDRRLHSEVDDATNNAVTQALRLTHTTSGTPAAGIGVGMEFEVETSASNNEVGATIEAIAADATSTSEDFDLVVRLMTAGAAVAEKFRIRSTGEPVFKPPASAAALSNNGEVTMQLTNNTTLRLLARGSDGTTRGVNLTLA